VDIERVFMLAVRQTLIKEEEAKRRAKKEKAVLRASMRGGRL
jgi:hypothetical protein